MTDNKPSQRNRRDDRDYARRLIVTDNAHTCSWKRAGGHDMLDVTIMTPTAEGSHWLSIATEEIPEKGNCRATMATLDEPAMRSLYDMLRAHFGEK